MENKLEQQHFYAHFANLGEGIVLPGAYDTAWLARVPEFPNLNKPAFPKALDWLRQNQLQDGSWGCTSPFNAHSNTLSTLVAVLAMAQWADPSDTDRIKSGLNALIHLAKELPKEKHQTVGFELLLPALVSELAVYNLALDPSVEEQYKFFEKLSQEKRQLIEQHHKAYGSKKPASWWFSLEMLGHSQDAILQIDESFLNQNGSVAASPSATAYLLKQTRYNGKDSPSAFGYLSRLMHCYGNNSGLPNVAPIDEFELVFSANYFLEAGVSPTEQQFSSVIEKIKLLWQRRDNKGCGYSSHFFTDPDCTATAMKVLKTVGFDSLDPKLLLTKFNGTHIETYSAERMASISTNLHVITALQLFDNDPEISNAIKAIVKWLNAQAHDEGPVFSDKWHSSPIYPISRAVIALTKLDPFLAKRCVNYLIKEQKTNGGWGTGDVGTFEETGFASLALTYWYRQGHYLSSDILKKAQQFLKKMTSLPHDTLWIGKVLYCPLYVSASIVNSAKFSLYKNLNRNETNFIKSNVQFFKNQSWSYVKYELPITAFQINLKGALLNIAGTKKIKVDVSAVEQANKQWVLHHELCDINHKLLSAGLAKGCSNAFQSDREQYLEIYTNYAFLLLFLDDILDQSWQKLLSTDELKDVFDIFIQILKNGMSNQNLPAENFPKFEAICSAFNDLRNKMLKNNCCINNFINSVSQYFNALQKEYLHRTQKTQLSLDEYLQLRVITGGTDTACELAYALSNLTFPNELYDNELFGKLKRHGYQALIIANDILSLSKESKDTPVTQNYITSLAAAKNLSLREALVASQKAYNKEIAKLFIAKQLLLNDVAIADRPTLTKVIQIIEHHIQAHLEFALKSARYQETAPHLELIETPQLSKDEIFHLFPERDADELMSRMKI